MENEITNEITNEETVTLTKKIYEDTQAWFNAVDEKNDALQDQVRALEKRNNLLVESLWPFLEQKILGLIDSSVHDQIADFDITHHNYFENAVSEIINDHDFSDPIDEAVNEIDLDYKIAEVINNGEFRFTR